MDSENLNTDKDLESPHFSVHPGKTGWFFILPLAFTLLIIIGITQVGSAKDYLNANSITDSEHGLKSKHKHELNYSALLANKEFSHNLRDTVYTDRDIWLELRIDQQMLYVHYRDGRVVKYPVSTGIPGASKSIESRPGLFAIFLKEEVHLSTQFNDARMNYFMPYNMGIGFHGLQGTGYYGHLGVRPSSHGCIRMRNDHVKLLFKQCDIGTLVLSHKGYSARTVAFAPEGFKNDAEYTKDEYIKLMAYNLGTLMEGKYFINPPRRLIIDGTIIPKSGITVSSSQQLPDQQLLPFYIADQLFITDRLNGKYIDNKVINKETENLFFAYLEINESEPETYNLPSIEVNEEKVKKYAHNPLGILPYFDPKK